MTVFTFRPTAVLMAAILLAGCGKPATEPPATGQPARLRIAVIPKGTTHVFWKSVEAGARQAAVEQGVELIWKGPIKENDRAQQIAIVEQFVSEGVAGIVLAPLDDTALRRPVQGAAANRIPVVIFDSALKGEAGKDFLSLVATNNRQGGILAGAELARLLGGRGKVVLLRYQEGSASTMEREAGFLAAIGKHPGIQVIVDNRYAGATAGEAKSAAMNLLDQIRAADGIFCPNESSTFGMLLALRQTNLAGKVKFVGFDGSEQLLDGLKNGEIQALAVQNPFKMGHESVTVLVNHLNGQPVPPAVDTGVALVTRKNLDTPEIRTLLGLK